MSRLFAVGLGLVALAVMTALERTGTLSGVRADPCAVLVTYLAFRFDLVGGAISALLLGFLLDVTAASPTGLHQLTLMVLFVLLRVVANAVQLDPGPKLWPVAAAAAFFHRLMVTSLVGLFSSGTQPLGSVWDAVWATLLTNAILAIPLLWVTDRVARRVHPEPEHLFLIK
ncbi:MAG: rod shape-determining protein MreD [Myxococcota bacterium]